MCPHTPLLQDCLRGCQAAMAEDPRIHNFAGASAIATLLAQEQEQEQKEPKQEQKQQEEKEKIDPVDQGELKNDLLLLRILRI